MRQSAGEKLQHYLKIGRGFVFPDYRPRYPRQPSFLIKHYRLEIELDLGEKRVDGLATISLEARGNTALLDAVDLEVRSVEGCGYDYDGRTLALHLQGEGRHEIRVRYRAWPRAGVYFILPDKANPDRLPFVYSHGEPEYHRHWMPIYDYPNMKFTTEMLVTVPQPLEVVSNGELISVKDRGDGLRVWHWSLDIPHTAYLMSFAAGVFDKVEEEFNGLKLAYYVPKGMKYLIKNSFEKTGDMIRFFSEYLDYPYPYKSYKQVCVPEFVVGGMENTTATTLTDLTLHDDHAHVDFSSNPLVAHELAHQWFGDLVTCRDWSHIWLNESFATYLENLYVLHDRGRDEFLYELYNDLKSYLDEYEERYSRPVVMRLYRYAEELFDRHAYPKGGLVLHTLKNVVGEESFKKGLNTFLKKHAFSTADTEDLRKALEQASGMALEHLFEQLVYSAGHPSVKVSYRWDEETKTFRLSLKQTQRDDSPETYSLEIECHIHLDGEKVVRKLSLEEREVSLHIPLRSKPSHICVDPEFKLLRVVEVERPVEEVLEAVEKCDSVVCRIGMVEFLGKHGGHRAVAALEKVVKNDVFWGVSYQAAKALGEVKSEEAKQALLRCLKQVRHPKVRRGVVEGLGSYQLDSEVAESLQKVIEDAGESYYVRQSACISLGRLKLSDKTPVLLKALSYKSHAHVIACGAVTGLAELGTDEAFPHIIERTEPSFPTPVRVSATVGLAKFPGKREAFEALEKLSHDASERVRHAVVAAARELLDPRLLSMLDRMSEKDLNERVRRGAREVARKIRDHLERGVEYKALREELDKIREENRKLADRIYRMEGKLS
ncbi:MAG: M1 family aminopeptidase [Candidatus Caldarchaeum sp.]|uniref:Aminopeptidase n=1 Tax=Caldiarchaeum subterraneum TaxID=311458 RepID=A0A7C5Q3X3_CALS0